VDERSLPVLLPEVESYEPADTGESPLSKIEEWVNTSCPKCGARAKRETDTMPQWAGSSWYFIRYLDPSNNEEFASKEALSYWMPVDWYNGGMEHTTLHLLYSRFWHKFLYDIGCVPTKEPYAKRTSHGMILGENNEKMSKSRGNVVNPDEIITEFGADTMRMYEMFIGDFEKSVPWSMNGVKGCRRFLERVWKMEDMLTAGDGYSGELETAMHRTIKKVTRDIENMKFNTAIAALMTLYNEVSSKGRITRAEYRTFLILLDPFSPHISEELWQRAGFDGRITEASWPVYSEEKTVEEEIEIAVQINGKVKAKVYIPKDADERAVKDIVHGSDDLKPMLEGKTVIKEIYVNGRIYNIVVKP
jgi:leucyl-tRNA synthetase